MEAHRWNWHLWAGFLICLVGFASYPVIFVKFPVTRDIPWVNFLLLAAGLAILFYGLRLAFGDSAPYRGKITGPILGLLSALIVGLFCYFIFFMAHQLPVSAAAPHVGQQAPEFELADINNQPVSLTKLLSTPLPGTGTAPKGVLLVFYRGYW